MGGCQPALRIIEWRVRRQRRRCQAAVTNWWNRSLAGDSAIQPTGLNMGLAAATNSQKPRLATGSPLMAS
ncbi:MAG: hypothetical protein Fur0021_36000 [Candidatus Promineifilaceae bacterium]